MDTDIGDVTKVCDACQLNQPAAPKVASQPWQYPDAPWQRVHVDYAGPVEGKMLLIIVDAYSKWPDVWITNNVSAQTTIDHLRMTFATHGLPEVIVSDNGGCFTSKEFGEFMSANQIRHVFTPPLHPASNGQAESMVKLVKNGIKKQKPAPLLTKLQRWLFQYRNTPHTTTGKAPAEMLFRRAPRTHLNRLHPLEERRSRSSVETGTVIRAFRTGDPVYITEVTASEYRWLPGTVLETCGPTCTVLLQDGRKFRRHEDHIRPRYTSGDTGLFREEGRSQSDCLFQPPAAEPGPAAPRSAPVTLPETLPAQPAAPPASSTTAQPVTLPPAAEPEIAPAPASGHQLAGLPSPVANSRPARNRRPPDRLNL
ncbi:uncharacterized protein K02A2.6-like [Amphibalanus amphitrite]|uniref:uncharacterized protein K02A2.6-like n=1 Tax=Amphibalanus amphitrite TaxID=1232801 RepID=UPI001C8FC252|nr:uncharacterized protein K02A2.6-like [Amphibalanus amphitrite]